MPRSTPESITNAELQFIQFEEAEYGFLHAAFQGAVENYGSTAEVRFFRNGLPEAGDTFTWQSGGGLYEYKITADIEGIVDGWPVNNWYVSQRSLGGPNEDKTFYIDVPAHKTHIIGDSGMAPANFKEISELSDIFLDLAAEEEQRRTANPYQFVRGKHDINPYYVPEGESLDD